MLLEKYYATQLPFEYTQVSAWMSTEGFITYCQIHKISPIVRLPLLSDGSLVKFLRALYLTDVTVNVKDQKEMIMTGEMAKFLGSEEGLKTIIRDAWLCCNERKLVYAHSFIDTSKIGVPIHNEINKKSIPVGMVLSDYNLPLLRDQLYISQIKSEQLAKELDSPENIFWIRCYHLKSSDGFNAAILEIFSPYLFETR